MKLKEAFEFKDKYKDKVMGQKFVSSDGSTSDGFNITDVLVSPIHALDKIILAMWEHDLSNEKAIARVNIANEDFEVYVVSDTSGNQTYTLQTTLLKHLQVTNQL